MRESKNKIGFWALSSTPQQEDFIHPLWYAPMHILKAFEKVERGIVSRKDRGNKVACTLQNWRLSLPCFWKLIYRYVQYWEASWQWILHIEDAILKCKRHRNTGFNANFLHFTSLFKWSHKRKIHESQLLHSSFQSVIAYSTDVRSDLLWLSSSLPASRIPKIRSSLGIDN